MKIELSSGLVKAYSYHKNNKLLDITTKDGTVYRYFEVPENTFKEFTEADNPGGYYKTAIRKKFKRLFKTYDLSVML